MSQNLGDIKLSILLDIVKADENARKFTAALKGVEDQSRKTDSTTVSLKGKLQNLGLTVDGLRSAFDLLRGTFGNMISAFQQQEIATAKLTNGLKNVGEGASALEKLNKQASILQSVTVYDDAEINNAQAMLTTFMKSSEEIEILTPRILDLAAAFDQSGQGGKSLQEVAVMLGKVNEETIGGLRRVGVAFSKEQEEKLKSLEGTEQAIYLSKILDQNFKGLAETIGQTSRGQITILQNKVGELKEKFGELLSKVLIPLIEPLKNFIDLIANSPGRVQIAAMAFGTLAGALFLLNGAMPGPYKYLSLLATIFIGLPDSLRNLAIAIGIVTAAWKYQSIIVALLDSGITKLAGNAEKGFSALANAGSRASAVLLLKLGAVAALIYAILETIDSINEEAPKMEKSVGKSDTLGGEDASMDNYVKQKERTKSGNEFFTKEEQQKTGEEIKTTKRAIEEFEDKVKKTDKSLSGANETLKETKDELQLLQEKYNSLIDSFERPFKMSRLEKSIELMERLGKPISEILKVPDAQKLQETESTRKPIEEVKGKFGKSWDFDKMTSEDMQQAAAQSLSLAQQTASILGIGADTFAGKFLGALQEGISLVNTFANFLNVVFNIGSGGIFGLLGFAGGGQVPGAGSGDTVPAMLTPGEYVIRKSVVNKIGSGFFEWINGGGLFNSLAGRYAQGGMVTAPGSGGVQVVVLESRVKGSDIVLSQARESRKTSRRII